jgi:hypothetical protein
MIMSHLPPRARRDRDPLYAGQTRSASTGMSDQDIDKLAERLATRLGAPPATLAPQLQQQQAQQAAVPLDPVSGASLSAIGTREELFAMVDNVVRNYIRLTFPQAETQASEVWVRFPAHSCAPATMSEQPATLANTNHGDS